MLVKKEKGGIDYRPAVKQKKKCLKDCLPISKLCMLSGDFYESFPSFLWLLVSLFEQKALHAVCK